MKLWTGQAPNPLRVEIYLAEKGLADIDRQFVDIPGGESRADAFRAVNSLGELPALALDDGTIITESVAICRYFEAMHPQPPLFGASPAEIGRVEMWNRRMEQLILEPVAQIGRHRFELFADKYEQVPAYAESQVRLAKARWAWLEDVFADGRPFVVGEQFTVADITGIAALVVAGFVGEPPDEDCPKVRAWEARLRQRNSWPQ